MHKPKQPNQYKGPHHLHRVSIKNKQNYFVITMSNFHQIWQFLAQKWQTV